MIPLVVCDAFNKSIPQKDFFFLVSSNTEEKKAIKFYDI